MANSYFENTKRGEIAELKSELNSLKEDKRKEAVKKVVAAMTVGKDVSPLFTDVLNCSQTTNLELKKLVYLYLMNYSKRNPDRAILAVSTFQKDAQDPNPLIRALAIRTMGCIRINTIAEYMCEPLRSCLKDRDPYVLKTAAVCVAKLHDVNAQLVEDQGFIPMLKELIGDSNPMVVANAVAALCEIDDASSTNIFKITSGNRNKLLTALEECNEWGQVMILNALCRYNPKDERHAANICNRVTPRLAHNNSAVVLAAVKVLMKYTGFIENEETIANIYKKMAPPLVTLLSKEPEIQYVALRNINLVLQKIPTVLQGEMKVFFCKYNDPIYVKMEKLEIIIMLASDRNIEQVLIELKEYATAVDVEFVRKAVRAIGRCAIKLEKAAEKAIRVLLDLIRTKVNYVVQEAIIVIKDTFRKYPNKYESIISILCNNLESLDKPEAKASMIWIIGEYAESIDNAEDLLEVFIAEFKDEAPVVQLQLLTATVKLFLKRPKDTQVMVQKVLNFATESDNPDLRDRGFIYWRLLSQDPEGAKSVVLASKPLISDHTARLEESVLDDLLGQISTLASVYHKPPETFVDKLRNVQKPQTPRPQKGKAAAVPDVEVPKLMVLTAENGHGLEVQAGFYRRDGTIFFDMVYTNHAQQPVQSVQIQFNTNTFRVLPAGQIQLAHPLMPGQTVEYSLPINTNGPQAQAVPSNIVQMAIKTNLGVAYFNARVPIHVLFIESGAVSKEDYRAAWRGLTNEKFLDVTGITVSTKEALQKRLGAHNIFFVASTKKEGQEVLYFSAKTQEGLLFLLEVGVASNGSSCKLCTKTEAEAYVKLLEFSVKYLITH